MFPALTSLTGGGGMGLGGPSTSSADSAADMGGNYNAGISFSSDNNTKWIVVAAAVVLLVLIRKGGK